jgi:hypothetical protein
MRQEILHEFVELPNGKDSGEELPVFGLQCYTHGHFVLSVAETGLDHVIDDGLVLAVLLRGRSLAALDVFLDAFVHQDFGELILGLFDVELRL